MTEQELTAIDQRVAIECMGWHKGKGDFVWRGGEGNVGYSEFESSNYWIDSRNTEMFQPGKFKPTRDLNHAGLVKEAMVKRGFKWATSIGLDTLQYSARFLDFKRNVFTFEEGDSECLVICLAALAACEALQSLSQPQTTTNQD